MEELKPNAFFDLNDYEWKNIFADLDMVWQVLDRIKDYVEQTINPNVQPIRKKGELVRENHVIWNGEIVTENFDLKPGDATKGKFQVFREGKLLEGAAVIYAGAALMDDEIEIGPGAVVEPGALIKGPSIIGSNTEVRQGAYVRGSCLVGKSCVVGHTTEMKNTVMLNGAKAGHFAYIGDSVLGNNVNLGAGTKLANLKIVSAPVKIRYNDDIIKVDRRKFGAILGDNVETGCNSVTSPGSVLAPGCLVAPNMTVAPGYYKRRSVIRSR